MKAKKSPDYEMDCPKCGTEVLITLDWEGGDCPNPDCDNYYWQEEFYTEDYSDGWFEVIWDSYDR